MKANEIMIGDWVVINENHPDCPFTRKVDIGDLSFFTKFDPIPLTAEILEKNGWKQDGRWMVLFHKEEYTIRWKDEPLLPCLVIEANDDYGSFRSRKIISVHQFQHALRLCGLTELADNFKI